MILQIAIAFIAILVLGTAIYFGRELYQRSVRMRNRAQLSVIFTNITHELLTPLTVISASVDRLRGQEPQYENDYDLMQLNIERMVRLLQQILETSKSQSGELKLLVSQGDVMEYIRRTALCIEPLMAKRGLEFSVQCTPESMMGWIDTDKLDKIIYNLLSNAAKYTGEHGRVELQVRTNKKYDHLIIKVADNGIGIPQDKMKRLFRRYYDGDYRRFHTMGTGLGLALTRELVYLNGGNITCESEENKGTTFTVTLPIRKEAFSASQIDEQNKVDVNVASNSIVDIALRMKDTPLPQPVVGATPAEDAFKLLIVEDNVELLMLMKQLLGAKYFVFTASNGAQAMDIIRKNELDLIVSDVMMPVMNGLELTAAVKRNPKLSHLPIILLTAKTQEKDYEDALQSGADEYIAKPFKLKELELRINNLIENRRRIQREMAEGAGAQDMNLFREPTSEEQFLKQAAACVFNHLDDSDFDRVVFATEMGASTSTLYNKIRSLTGMNVSGFIRDIRMKEAKRMIQQNPSIRVSDLAYKVGFRDPKYFATCFKKDFGMQPSEYIESLATTPET